LILDQVTNGVAVRMAVLYLLAGASKENGTRKSPAVKNGARKERSGKLFAQ
jgi:hypothetical protein